MSPTPKIQTPIIIGTSDIINRSLEISDAIEPLQLMIQAVEAAFLDTGLEGRELGLLRRSVDDVGVVRGWTWGYKDVCGGVLEGVWGGADGGGRDGDRTDGDGTDGDRGKKKAKGGKEIFMEESRHGGDSPVRLLDGACRRVAGGRSSVAVVVGGEALGSLTSAITKTGTYPPHWTPPTSDPRSVLALPKGAENPGTIHNIGLPIHVYPLFENAFRAHRHQSPAANRAESAKIYAQFAKIAAKNEYAWNRTQAGKLNEESIGTVGRGNRMICWPYPLLMNAFNNVNMAASCIVTSVEFARELGISEEKWIYPLGGAGMRERENFWERPNFYSSEALETSLDSALDVSGLKTEDIDLFDFYSCFPIVPKMAAHHLKIPFVDPPKPITLLGGLTSFGGAGNNYSLHAVSEMVRQLRKKRSQAGQGEDENKDGGAFNGLVLANGGVLTYQHVVCLSTQPRRDGKQYQDGNPCPDVVKGSAARISGEGSSGWSEGEDGDAGDSGDGLDIVGLEGVGSGVWEGVIETYTVQFSRQNEPEIGFVIGRLKKNGKRFVANVGDEKTLRSLLKDGGEEVIGKSGWVWMEENGKRNLFRFENGARL